MALVGCGLPFASAGPAHAATATVTVSAGLAVTPTTVDLVAGDTLSIVNGSAFGLALKNGTGLVQSGSSVVCATIGASSPASACPVTSGPGITASFTVLATGTLELYRFSPTTLVATITVGPAGSGGVSSGAGSTPEPLIQQFGLPATGSCDAAAPAGLNWGGAGTGGWGVSWAQWVNGGAGGPVCTRTLSYSNALGRWVTS